MGSVIAGISFERHVDGYAICHIDHISEQLKDIIRRSLASICHGSRVSIDSDFPLFSYHATLRSFLERYEGKPENTKKGMIGELLAHILFIELFDDFEVASAFFNLEEKSIKKGFDLLLYRAIDQSLWISEVKSGNLHVEKNHDQTTATLLDTAKYDLKNRLNQQEIMYWLNAINSVTAAVSRTKDYKDILSDVLHERGASAYKNEIKSSDTCVILVSTLFEPLGTKISSIPACDLIAKLKESKIFSDVVLLCVQKSTFAKVYEFLKIEVDGVSPHD